MSKARPEGAIDVDPVDASSAFGAKLDDYPNPGGKVSFGSRGEVSRRRSV